MIRLVDAEENLEDFILLVREYTSTIALQDGEVAQTLVSQHLDDELQDTKRKYGFPDGRMYLLLVDEQAAGCVALTKNDDKYCEIKRLYVRPQYRGQHLSRILCDKVIDDAREIGYQFMRLDTFPFMKNAIRLYEGYGFYYIECYNDNPAKNAVFMELKL